MVLASPGLAASLLLRADPRTSVGVSAADAPIERQLQELVIRPDHRESTWPHAWSSVPGSGRIHPRHRPR